MVNQVLQHSDNTINVQVLPSDSEDSFDMRPVKRYSVNSDELEFPDFDWERDDSHRHNSSMQSPRHRRIQGANEGGSRGSSPGPRRGSRGWSPLVHAHTIVSPTHQKQSRNGSLGNNAISSSTSRLDGSGSDSLQVPSATHRSSHDNPVAKRRGLHRSEEVKTVDLE